VTEARFGRSTDQEKRRFRGVKGRAVPLTESRGIGRVGPFAGKITGRACVPGRTGDRVPAVAAGSWKA
jgi:hypothetical protein